MVFLLSRDGYVRNFVSCTKGMTDLSRFKEEGVISLETPQPKRTSSGLEGRTSWFFSNCGRFLSR